MSNHPTPDPTDNPLGLSPEVFHGLGAYVTALNAATDRHWARRGFLQEPPRFSIDPLARRGRFLRIVQLREGRVSSVHSFVEQVTGKVIKPAGFKAPAKSTAAATRGELLSQYRLDSAPELDRLLARLESDDGCLYGGYLYQGC